MTLGKLKNRPSDSKSGTKRQKTGKTPEAERKKRRKAGKAAVLEIKKRWRFTFGAPILIYILILAFSLVFTQALRSPLSSVFYIGMLIFPLFSLGYMFICAAAVKVSAYVDHSEVRKLSPVTFTIDIENPTFLPMPFVECDITVPCENAVRCVTRRAVMFLAPGAHIKHTRTVTFSYRGTYSVGVERVYVSDLLKMFRFRLDVYSLMDVFVMPRRLIIAGEADVRAADVSTDSAVNLIGAERSEVSDIRDYRMGDHMKSIHWKLSSKKEDLITKEYTMDSGKTTYVFADMAVRYDRSDPACEDDINEFAADSVVECAIAASMRELRSHNNCTLIWYDSRASSQTAVYTMQTTSDFSKVYPVIATAPQMPSELNFADLTALTDETHAVAMLFVTPRLDKRTVTSLMGIAAAFGSITAAGALQVLYCPPDEKLSMTEDERDFEQMCLTQLRTSGVKLVRIKLPKAGGDSPESV